MLHMPVLQEGGGQEVSSLSLVVFWIRIIMFIELADYNSNVPWSLIRWSIQAGKIIISLIAICVCVCVCVCSRIYGVEVNIGWTLSSREKLANKEEENKDCDH